MLLGNCIEFIEGINGLCMTSSLEELNIRDNPILKDQSISQLISKICPSVKLLTSFSNYLASRVKLNERNIYIWYI